MYTLIVGVLLGGVIASNSYALRCGNTLLTKGMDIGSVESACQISSSYDVGGPMASGDIKYRMVREGSFTHKLVFIDGVLNTIDEER